MADANPAPGTGTTYIPEDETPQTNTPKENSNEQVDSSEFIPAPGTVVLTQEQFDSLIKRLDSGSTTDKSPAPSMTPGIGLQTNPFGQVVGTVTKFNVDPNYYPNPVERLLDEVRFSRFNLRENYFIVWDISAKPYQTKDNLSVQEPTFHLTLYQNLFDDEGDELDRSIVVQTLHMNEDEELARLYASEQGITVTDETLKELMDATRYERSKRWLENIFFPPKNFELNVDAREEAIGGSVVKVITKSNVKGFGNPTPKIEDAELS